MPVGWMDFVVVSPVKRTRSHPEDTAARLEGLQA